MAFNNLATTMKAAPTFAQQHSAFANQVSAFNTPRPAARAAAPLQSHSAAYHAISPTGIGAGFRGGVSTYQAPGTANFHPAATPAAPARAFGQPFASQAVGAGARPSPGGNNYGGIGAITGGLGTSTGAPGMHFARGGAIPDPNDDDTQSGDQQADNSSAPRPIGPKPSRQGDQPVKPFDPRDYLPGKQASSGAIPENGSGQGTDINEAMATVDHVLQFGRSQSGLGAPPSAIPQPSNDTQGYAAGGPVHKGGPGRKGNKFKGSEDGSAGEGGPDLNSDFHFGEQGADAEDVPQPGAAPGSPQTSPQYSPMGLQTQPSYADGGDIEDPADSSLAPQQEAIPTGDTLEPPPDSGTMGSAQGATGEATMAGGAQGAQGVAQSDPKKIVGYLQGAGAASAKAVQAAEDATGEDQPAMKALAVINDAYKHGGPEAAWPIMQSYRQQHELQTTLAKVKLQEGNVAAAAQAATEADANVLDGTQTHFSPTVGGQGVTATTAKLGNDQPFQHIKLGLQQFGQFLGTLYDQKMDESTAVALQKANKSAGAAAMGNIGPTDGPSDIGKQLGTAGAVISKGAQALAEPVPDAPAAGGEDATPGSQAAGPGPDAGTETSTPTANQPMMMPPRGASPVAAPQPGQAQPAQQQRPRVATTMEQDRRAAAEASFGKENVDAAYQQFPGINENRARAKFLNEGRATGIEQTSREKQATAKQEGETERAKMHYGPQGSVDRTNDARGQQNQARIDGRAAETNAKLVAAGGRELTKEQNDVLKSAIAQNPRLSQDPMAAIAFAKRLQENWAAPANTSVGTSGVNSGVRTPGSQVAAPTYPTPTADHIRGLQQNPKMAAAYDAKFGPGASAKVLRGGQ